MNYFIMMNNQAGTHIMPIVDDHEDVAMFGTFEEAEACAEGNDFAVAFGYEIFERGDGCF